MTILIDIKTFLITNNLASSVFYNFDDSDANSSPVILSLKKGEQSDLSEKSTVEIIVKNKSMQSAESQINSIYSALYPENQFEKPIWINSKLMMIKPLSPPYYKEKEKSSRHVFALEINVIHKR